MYILSKRFSVIAGFGLLLLLLLLNAFVTRRQLDAQIDDQRGVMRTRKVLFELVQTESLLKDAETGQRGFLYTGDPKYLTPYNTAVSQVQSHIDALARLTVDDPTQQSRIPHLRGLTQQKLNELAITISLYRSGKTDQAKALVLSDRGLLIMNDIRSVAADMELRENALEQIRAATYLNSINRTIASIYLASALGTIGLILLAYYIVRYMELREKHTAELRARDEWFRVALTSIGDGVVATDPDGKVIFLNPVAEKLTGTHLADVLGHEIADVFPIFNEFSGEPTENPITKVMEQGCIVAMANHTVLLNTSGTLIPIEDSAAPIRDAQNQLIGVVLVFRDVTKERRAHDLLRRTEKLTAAARLSATMAHEINNPLEAVMNLIYIAKLTPDAPSSMIEQLEMAERELERVVHITRQSLGFYRETSAPELVEMPKIIESVLKLYSNKFKSKNITVQREFAECPPVRGVAGELIQVISNLVSNAADAVARNGVILIRTHCVESIDGSFVEVKIEDDGPGIPLENVDQIFEPFFTTKTDVGTGLGLWVTKEIVDRHGGTILVRSREDNPGARGAAFTIQLPSAPTEPDGKSHSFSSGNR
jgi:PAS domain S-box-containing protein